MMKTLAIVAVLLVAQAYSELRNQNIIDISDVHPVRKTFDEIEGAPKYPDSRIINGIAASRGQFPHQAALFLNGRNFCGGSLISSRWVLTAAHCAFGISSFVVYLGALNLNAATEAGRLVIETRSKVVHSGYLVLLAPNDIALVDLGQDVSFTDHIQPIALALGDNDFEGAAARVSGWGKTSDASDTVSPQLNYVDLSIISNAECRKTYGLINVRASTICAVGSGGRSACNGDSGGPLLDRSSGKQIGIVSYGSREGCESGSPNAFARVTAYTSWIATKTGISL